MIYRMVPLSMTLTLTPISRSRHF